MKADLHNLLIVAVQSGAAGRQSGDRNGSIIEDQLLTREAAEIG